VFFSQVVVTLLSNNPPEQCGRAFGVSLDDNLKLTVALHGASDDQSMQEVHFQAWIGCMQQILF
jgi:hypothetical protein